MFVDRYYLQSHRMVWAAAGFVVGLLCMESSGSRWWALLLLLGALCCWHWRQEAWQQGVLFFVMVLVGCAVLQGQLAAQQTMTPTGDTITVQGRVTESREGQGYFWLQVENPSAQWTRRDGTATRPEKELLQEREVLSEKEILYVSVPRSPVLGETEAVPVWYPAGSQIMVTGVLAKPQRQRNPGGFDEALWLRSKQARYQLQAQKITVLQEPQGVWRISLQLRNFIEQTAYRCLPAAEADTALALLLGEKQRLEQSFYRLTQRMGTAHIFAVSGLHVGFVGALLLYGLRLVGGSRSWLAFLLLSVVLFFYCLLTGLPPSAMRAAVMILLAALALRLLRPVVGLDFWAAAALLLLLDNPFLLWTAGFQLSFGVTLALLLLVTPIQRKLGWLPWTWLRSSIAVALAACLGSFPLSAWHFYSVSLFSPLFNLLLVPVVSVLVPLLFLAFVLTFLFSGGGGVFFLPVHCFLQVLLHGTIWLSRWLGSGHWYIGRPSTIALLCYLLVLLLLWAVLQERDKQGYLWCGTVLAMVCVLWLCMPAKLTADTLLYLDAGQGSCAVLRTSAGETIIFDGGAQQRELASCLAWYGVNRVDAIVLSHCDTDHINGILQVLENVPVTCLFAERQQLQRETAEALLAAAARQNTRIKPLDDGAEVPLRQGKLKLQVYGNSRGGTNSCELAAVLQLSGDTVAFPGDLGLEAVQSFAAEQQRITIWTVPHHGSRYSASAQLYQLLREKGMQKAVISAGNGNSYGHPHQEVVQILQQQQTVVYRTDQQGAVLLRLHHS